MKKVQEERGAIGLCESLASHSPYKGRDLVMHLVMLTREGNVYMVQKDGVWSVPYRPIPVSGTLMMFPNTIIEEYLSQDAAALRGSSPAYGDTKLLCQHEDEGGKIHLFVRVYISPIRRTGWKSFSGFASNGRDNFSEMTVLALTCLGWKQPSTLALAA